MIRPFSAGDQSEPQPRGLSDLPLIPRDPGGIPHIGHAPSEIFVPGGLPEAHIQIAERRQAGVIQRSEQAVASHGSEAAMRRKDDIPTRIAGNSLRQHFLITFIGSVTDPHAPLPLEQGNGRGIDIARPVINVEPRPLIARARESRGAGKEKGPAFHVFCSLCDSRIRKPKATTMRAETAFTTGLTPRRAIAYINMGKVSESTPATRLVIT